MKYNTFIPDEKKQAMSYFMRLVNKKVIIEVKKVSPGRTLHQNSYLHLLLGAYGVHFGYTLEEAKIVYKRDINPSLYVYKKEIAGRSMAFLRSSADLTKEEMMISIDNLMRTSAEAGYPLPKAEDKDWIRELENQIEAQNHFLYG